MWGRGGLRVFRTRRVLKASGGSAPRARRPRRRPRRQNPRFGPGAPSRPSRGPAGSTVLAWGGPCQGCSDSVPPCRYPSRSESLFSKRSQTQSKNPSKINSKAEGALGPGKAWNPEPSAPADWASDSREFEHNGSRTHVIRVPFFFRRFVKMMQPRTPNSPQKFAPKPPTLDLTPDTPNPKP